MTTRYKKWKWQVTVLLTCIYIRVLIKKSSYYFSRTVFPLALKRNHILVIYYIFFPRELKTVVFFTLLLIMMDSDILKDTMGYVSLHAIDET